MSSETNESRVILTISEAQNKFLKEMVRQKGYLSRQDAIRYLVLREMEASA
jgi:Arc/MetJ-type ribon-helix-helix transcriptional regulator